MATLRHQKCGRTITFEDQFGCVVRIRAAAIELALGALHAISDRFEERQTFGRGAGGRAGRDGKRDDAVLELRVLRLADQGEFGGHGCVPKIALDFRPAWWFNCGGTASIERTPPAGAGNTYRRLTHQTA